MRVVVLSGISGSGKSTYAEKLKSDAGGCAAIVSADQFFENEAGVYSFDKNLLDQAHQHCFRNFMAAIEIRTPLIIVANTNCNTYEISPYFLAAKAFGYDPELVTIMQDVKVCEQRNSHGVNSTIISRQLKNIQNRYLPASWKRSEYRSGV